MSSSIDRTAARANIYEPSFSNRFWKDLSRPIVFPELLFLISWTGGIVAFSYTARESVSSDPTRLNTAIVLVLLTAQTCHTLLHQKLISLTLKNFLNESIREIKSENQALHLKFCVTIIRNALEENPVEGGRDINHLPFNRGPLSNIRLCLLSLKDRCRRVCIQVMRRIFPPTAVRERCTTIIYNNDERQSGNAPHFSSNSSS